MPSRPTSGHRSPVTLHLIGPDSWSEVPALLCYDAHDPFAVRITFGGQVAGDGVADPDGALTWLLSRELLHAGLDRPSGEGDVRLWPARGSTDVLHLQLRAPTGEALFELSRATVAAFLRQTEALVPPGTESAQVDIDDELQLLLPPGRPDSPGR